MSKVELTSKEIEDSQYFIKDAKAPDLLVLVEDEQDVPFWKKMFECVSNQYHSIHIHSLKTSPRQAKKDGSILTGTGKENLMNIDPSTLGRSKMIAVDADYDLLIDDYHKYTSRIREGHYIVHTEYYAIENHLINKNTLQALEIWKRLGTERIQRSWDDILSSFRDAVCRSVKLCIASNAYRIHEMKAKSQHSFILYIRTLHSEVKKLSFNPKDYKDDNAKWKTNIEAKYSSLEKICSKEFSEVDKIIPDSDILYHIQGHTLYDYIEKVVRYYIKFDYKNRVSNLKKDLISKGEKENIEKTIADLRSSIKVTSNNNCINESIYNANALDMRESGIVDIQNQIKSICK